MDAEITIRNAYSDDISDMVGLLSELFAIEDDFIIDSLKQMQGLELLLQKPDAKILVAVHVNRVVGMISMQSLISTAIGGRVGLIEDMIVSMDFRRMGIGKLLLAALIEESEQLGYERLSLGVDRRNDPALHFYEGIGFKISNMGLMYRAV
jgi:ribosomal protein S18 acetylase RimI-like enzyme